MTAEYLRETAQMMREMAEAATPGPWMAEDPTWSGFFHNGEMTVGTTYPDESMNSRHGADAAHVASWHPGVALAVAAWLDEVARDAERRLSSVNSRLPAESQIASVRISERAMSVARAYRGDDLRNTA